MGEGCLAHFLAFSKSSKIYVNHCSTLSPLIFTLLCILFIISTAQIRTLRLREAMRAAHKHSKGPRWDSNPPFQVPD